MVVLTIFIFILLISLSFIKNNLNASLIRRLCAISFICAGVLIINTLKIQEIGSGIGLYSELFQLDLISLSFSLYLLLILFLFLKIFFVKILPHAALNLLNNIKKEGALFAVVQGLLDPMVPLWYKKRVLKTPLKIVPLMVAGFYYLFKNLVILFPTSMGPFAVLIGALFFILFSIINGVKTYYFISRFFINRVNLPFYDKPYSSN